MKTVEEKMGEGEKGQVVQCTHDRQGRDAHRCQGCGLLFMRCRACRPERCPVCGDQTSGLTLNRS